MTAVEKLLARMRRNPRDWRIADLTAIADRLGIDWVHEGGSHVIFRHPDREHLSVPAARPIKPIYIKKFLMLVDKVRGPGK
jgi:predicted RNA binding protein YcfA (HicA-like mRNA interferase family)